MANSAAPDQLASDRDLHCLQRQGISGFNGTRVNLANSVDTDQIVPKVKEQFDQDL